MSNNIVSVFYKQNADYKFKYYIGYPLSALYLIFTQFGAVNVAFRPNVLGDENKIKEIGEIMIKYWPEDEKNMQTIN